VTSNVKGKIERSPKICQIWGWFWRSGGMKSSDFYCKRHILALIQVVWAILREGPLGSDPTAEIEKSQKVTRWSHRNDVSPLTQGLRYRAACDKTRTRLPLFLFVSLHFNFMFLIACERLSWPPVMHGKYIISHSIVALFRYYTDCDNMLLTCACYTHSSAARDMHWYRWTLTFTSLFTQNETTTTTWLHAVRTLGGCSEVWYWAQYMTDNTLDFLVYVKLFCCIVSYRNKTTDIHVHTRITHNHTSYAKKLKFQQCAI